MHHFAFVVRHVEQNAAVRIGPDPLGHGPLQSDFFLRFVGNTSSVMCEKRSVHQHKAHDERQRHYERKPHKSPPQRISNTERPDTAITHALSSGLLTMAAIAYLQNYFGWPANPWVNIVCALHARQRQVTRRSYTRDGNLSQSY